MLHSYPAGLPGDPSVHRQVCRRVLVWEGNRVHLHSSYPRESEEQDNKASQNLFSFLFFSFLFLLNTCPVLCVLVHCGSTDPFISVAFRWAHFIIIIMIDYFYLFAWSIGWLTDWFSFKGNAGPEGELGKQSSKQISSQAHI